MRATSEDGSRLVFREVAYFKIKISLFCSPYVSHIFQRKCHVIDLKLKIKNKKKIIRPLTF